MDVRVGYGECLVVADLDIVHPERSLLVVAEAEFPAEDVEDVLVLEHGVALQTPGSRASADDLLPGVDIWKIYCKTERLASNLLAFV